MTEIWIILGAFFVTGLLVGLLFGFGFRMTSKPLKYDPHIDPWIDHDTKIPRGGA